MEKSSLEFYSFGYVLEDIKLGTSYIDVHPVEQISSVDGNFKKPDPEVINNINIKGENESLISTETNSIRVKWLPFGSYNRLTPPTVCKGDFVLILTFGNSEDKFWLPLYVEPRLRNHEVTTYVFSNKKGLTEVMNLEDYYYFHVDTFNKITRYHAGDNDGEFTSYDFEINGKDGYAVLTDGRDNEIILNSKEDTIFINTNKKVVINTKDHIQNNENTTETIKKNKKITIGEKFDIFLSKFQVANKQYSLLQVLTGLIDDIIAMQHIGNNNIPTSIKDSSKSKLEKRKSELKTFM